MKIRELIEQAAREFAAGDGIEPGIPHLHAGANHLVAEIRRELDSLIASWRLPAPAEIDPVVEQADSDTGLLAASPAAAEPLAPVAAPALDAAPAPAAGPSMGDPAAAPALPEPQSAAPVAAEPVPAGQPSADPAPALDPASAALFAPLPAAADPAQAPAVPA